MRGIAGVTWWHVYGLALSVLLAVYARAAERYTPVYQTPPILDWVEARPPLVESAAVPPARALVEAAGRLLPGWRSDGFISSPRPAFEVPSNIVRVASGLRDSGSVRLSSPVPAAGAAAPGDVRDEVRLTVYVFNRGLRATAWADLRAIQLDLRRAAEGPRQLRGAPTDARARVWLSLPPEVGAAAGEARVVGTTGPIGYEVAARSTPDNRGSPDGLGLTVRAEAVARGVAERWLVWLRDQPWAL